MIKDRLQLPKTDYHYKITTITRRRRNHINTTAAPFDHGNATASQEISSSSTVDVVGTTRRVISSLGGEMGNDRFLSFFPSLNLYNSTDKAQSPEKI